MPLTTSLFASIALYEDLIGYTWMVSTVLLAVMVASLVYFTYKAVDETSTERYTEVQEETEEDTA